VPGSCGHHLDHTDTAGSSHIVHSQILEVEVAKSRNVNIQFLGSVKDHAALWNFSFFTVNGNF
jgi:hypothetical protein